MRVYTGHMAFSGNRAEIQQFKAIYLKNPPNVVIADMQSEELYGRHRRVSRLWQFIYISKCYVDNWAAAEDETSKMGYEVLLKATLVHESAHWAQTLAGLPFILTICCSLTSLMQRVGLYPNLTRDEADNLSPCELLKLKKKMTPKRFRTFAAQGASGEAGYYVELTVFGGVVFMQNGNCASYMLFSVLHSLEGFAVAIATSNTCVNRVSVNALKEIKSLGLCQLVSQAAPLPNPTLNSPTPIRNRQGAPATLYSSCNSDDEELFLNRCPREYPGMKLHSTCCYH